MEGIYVLEYLKSVQSPFPKEEGATQTTRDELTATPIPCPPETLWRYEVENSEVKLSQGGREE